jgi:hypothetical protein
MAISSQTAKSIRIERGVEPLVHALGTPAPPTDDTTIVHPGANTLGDIREQAAELLLRDLDRVVADFVREVAYVHTRIPLWAVIVGALQRCYEDATLIAPVLPPMVRRQTEGFVPPGQLGDTFCEACGQSFHAKRFRQRTCGQPDCGAIIVSRDLAQAAQRQNAHLINTAPPPGDAPGDLIIRGSGLRADPIEQASGG